jgi:hypothetical protein
MLSLVLWLSCFFNPTDSLNSQFNYKKESSHIGHNSVLEMSFVLRKYLMLHSCRGDWIHCGRAYLTSCFMEFTGLLQCLQLGNPCVPQQLLAYMGRSITCEGAYLVRGYLLPRNFSTWKGVWPPLPHPPPPTPHPHSQLIHRLQYCMGQVY